MTEEAQPVSADLVVKEVMNDAELLQALNDNPAKVMLSPDGTEAELSIGEVVPAVVAATIHALDRLGVISFIPNPDLAEQPPVG